MIWKPVLNFDGYEISNTGLIKGLKGKILKQHKTDNDYWAILLLREGKQIHVIVSVLVATAFVPNPDNKPEVNHKDADKDNNNDWNLEWSTRPENMAHAAKLGLLNNSSYFPAKAVNQYDLDNNLINSWFSMGEACRILNFKNQQGISNVCSGLRKTYKGYIWKYA